MRISFARVLSVFSPSVSSLSSSVQLGVFTCAVGVSVWCGDLVMLGGSGTSFVGVLPSPPHLAQGNVTSAGNWVKYMPTVQTSRYCSGRNSGEAYVEQSSSMADLCQPPSTSLQTKTTLGGCTL